MCSKDKAEPCLARQSVNLRVLRMRKWLRKCISVLLMLGNIVSKVHEDGLFEFLDLAARP